MNELFCLVLKIIYLYLQMLKTKMALELLHHLVFLVAAMVQLLLPVLLIL